MQYFRSFVALPTGNCVCIRAVESVRMTSPFQSEQPTFVPLSVIQNFLLTARFSVLQQAVMGVAAAPEIPATLVWLQ